MRATAYSLSLSQCPLTARRGRNFRGYVYVHLYIYTTVCDAKKDGTRARGNEQKVSSERASNERSLTFTSKIARLIFFFICRESPAIRIIGEKSDAMRPRGKFSAEYSVTPWLSMISLSRRIIARLLLLNCCCNLILNIIANSRCRGIQQVFTWIKRKLDFVMYIQVH